MHVWLKYKIEEMHRAVMKQGQKEAAVLEIEINRDNVEQL